LGRRTTQSPAKLALHGLAPLALLFCGSAAWGQQKDLDAINERTMRERELRLSQQSPRALIDNVVIQRLRPEYDAAGIDAGGFRIFPTLGVQLVYDSNVFETPNPESDEELVIQPGVSIRSKWQRHALGLNASATVERFARHPTENLTNYEIGANGALDFGLGGHLFGLGRIGRDHESRGTVGDLFPGGEPVRFRYRQLSSTLEEHLPGVFMSLIGDYYRYRYEDVRYQGVTYSQDYRNRQEARVNGQLAFKLNAGLAFFTEVAANDVNYSDQKDVDFSSHGQSVLAGFTFQSPSMWSGEIGVGYLRQEYDRLPIPPVDGPTYDFAFIWNVTPLLTGTFNAHRSIQQTPFVQAPSIIESRLSAQFDYELLRNLLINVHGVLILDDFGRGYRTDTRYEQSVSAQFLINRTLRATASIEYRDQNARSSFLRPYQGVAIKIGLQAQR